MHIRNTNKGENGQWPKQETLLHKTDREENKLTTVYMYEQNPYEVVNKKCNMIHVSVSIGNKTLTCNLSNNKTMKFRNTKVKLSDSQSPK